MTYPPLAFYMTDKPPILPAWQRPIYFAYCFVRIVPSAIRQCWWMARVATAMTKGKTP